MKKNIFIVLFSFCLLFCLPLTALATSDDDSGIMPDSMLEPIDMTYYYNQSSTYPAYVGLYDFNSAILDHVTGSGSFNYHTDYNPPYDEAYSGTFSFTEMNGVTYYRFSGVSSFYFFVSLPMAYQHTVGSGQLSQILTFDSIQYYATIGGTPTSIPVSQPHLRVVDAEMISAVGVPYQGAVLRAGNVNDYANIAYRFSDCGFGTRSQYLKITVEYSFLVYGTQSAPLPSDTLNGYARLGLRSCTGVFDLTSGFMSQAAFMNQYSQQLQDQNEQMMNGYDSSSGEDANSSLQSGLAVYESDEAQAQADFSNKMDAYEFPDVAPFASGVSFVASCMTSWFNGLGIFQIVLFVAFGLMIFNFISRYRGGGG